VQSLVADYDALNANQKYHGEQELHFPVRAINHHSQVQLL
jgi:hypothetical protein